MLLVNEGLTELGLGKIPHLILDHLALRLSPEAYARVFECAVHAWASGPERSLAERHPEAVEKKARFYDFIARLGTAGTDAEREELVRREPETARLALIP